MFVVTDSNSEKHARTYYEALNLTLLTQKYRGAVFQYILRPGSLWHLLNGSMLKCKRIFSLVISKLMFAFSLWLYNLMQPTIILTNTSKNNSRSLSAVTILSSLLNFGMFAFSATLILRFSHFISKTGGFG